MAKLTIKVLLTVITYAGFIAPMARAETAAQATRVVTEADSLADLISKIPVSQEVELVLLPGHIKVSSTLTIPPNVSLTFKKGAILQIEQGLLNIRGPIEAGFYQIFAGPVSFRGNQFVNILEAKWWGAKGDDSTDDTAALSEAMEAAYSGDYRLPVHFTPGNYRACNLSFSSRARNCALTAECPAPSRIYSDTSTTLRGATIKATDNCGTKSGDAVVLAQTISSSTIEDIRVDGNAKSGVPGSGASCFDGRYLGPLHTTGAAVHNSYRNLMFTNCQDSAAGFGALFDSNEDSEYTNITIQGGNPKTRTGTATGFRYLDAQGNPMAIISLKIYNGDFAQLNTQNATLINPLLIGGLVIGSDGDSANNLIKAESAQITPNKHTGVVIEFRKGKSPNASENFICISCFLATGPLNAGEAVFSGNVLNGIQLLGGRVNTGAGQMFKSVGNSFIGFPPMVRFTNTSIVGNQPASTRSVIVDHINTNSGHRTYSGTADPAANQK